MSKFLFNEDKMKSYMEMARAMAKNSPDAETQVGAIMLSSEGRLIASSYNGFLRGAPDDKLPKSRNGNPNKYEFIQHAERNMLYNCAYEGIRTKDTTIVCTLSPCTDCLRASFQSGVRFIVFDELYSKFPNTDFYTELPDVHVAIQKIGEYTLLEMYNKKEYDKEREEFKKFIDRIKKEQAATND
jgi:dCMP deaminase